MEGSSRGLIYWTIPKISWIDWGRPQKISVRIAVIEAEIWTQDFPNAK
jgi:hypothetical protein